MAISRDGQKCSACGGTYSFAHMAVEHSEDCMFNPKNAGAYASKAPKPDVAPEELLPNGAQISPAQAVQLMSLAVLMKDGELLFRAKNSEMATAALQCIQDVGQEIALQVRKDDLPSQDNEPQGDNVLKLHKNFPAQQVVPTLRTIINQIERGDYDTVTTACVCIGHTYEHPDPDRPGIRAMKSNFFTFAAGPRVDMFTVRGLLLTCANTLGNG